MPNLQNQQTGTPPLPPDVTRQQQGDPLAQYAQKAAANGANGGQGQPNPGMQFMMQELKTVAASMEKMAKYLAVERPELMPILKQMAGAGKTLETEFSKSQAQGQNPTAPALDPAQEAPEGASTIGLSE